LLSESTKIDLIMTLNFQCTTHDAMIPFYDWLIGLNVKILINRKEYFELTDFWATLTLQVVRHRQIVTYIVTASQE
jgi:hypothetical protein